MIERRVVTGKGSARRLSLLLLFCFPSLVAASTLGIDNVTRHFVGASLTSRGGLGAWLGLAAFLSGFASILAWPIVIVIGVGLRAAGAVTRALAIAGCLIATYSAAFFAVEFIIVPIAMQRMR